LIAWLRCCSSLIRSLTDVSSLNRSSRALPVNQITALPPVL